MNTELTKLQARAKALKNRLDELDAAYKAGAEDIGRITRMKTTLETERIEILLEVQETLGDEVPAELASAIQRAQESGNEQEVKEDLKKIAEEKGWGKKILNRINEHKGDIIDLVVTIAVKFAKEMAGML